MSLPKHKCYKNSGVPWLGELPSHWQVQRYKNIFAEREERSKTGDETLLSVSAYTGVSPRSEIVDEGDHLSRAESLEGYKVCYPNDLVMNIMLAWNKGLGFSTYHGIVSPAYSVFKLRPGNLPRFLDYMVRSEQVNLYYKAFSAGVIDSRLRLYPNIFGSLSCLLPPLAEQIAIATFLDRETAKIDALIAEQEKLIALLAEKRQATISHAVTRGLNPDAPMKDSGVAWLGKVPAHWEKIQLGRLCKQVSDGPHFSPSYVDEGVMFLSARNIKVDCWSLDDAKYISEDDYIEFCRRVTPNVDDVLYTKGGTTGIARVVDFHERFQVWVHVAVLKLHQHITLPHFVAYALNSIGCYEQSQLYTRGATNQDLGLTRMVKILLALPPKSEQSAIVTYLDVATAKIDSLTIEAKHAVRLLNERRSALISAAVTGKIDVRQLVAQISADENTEAI